MVHSGLLQDCRDYFQRAQSSWDAYFSKWETMAGEEECIEEEGDLLSGKEEENWNVRRHGKVSMARQLRKKSIAFLNGKRLMSNVERKSKWKRERVQSGKSRDRKRETEIIHTTENQTNLECEVVNNKHFEADLKAIFIEILSENTNKMGMFSVLSRTFPGSGETISNFSLSSMIMEKNGFSISSVSKTVLHSVSRNEFPPGAIHGGRGLRDASARSCVNVTPSHASNNGLRADCSNVRQCHITPKRNQRITTNDLSDVTPRWEREKYIPVSIDSFRRQRTSTTAANSPDGCSDKIVSDSPGYLSPAATLRKIRSTPASTRKKCVSKRKRTKSFLDSSDDDSEEDTKATPGKFLKIFCTPKRPRRPVKYEAETMSDDDDCFRIFDRVKTEKN